MSQFYRFLTEFSAVLKCGNGAMEKSRGQEKSESC